jgi:hypothetical protein
VELSGRRLVSRTTVHEILSRAEVDGLIGIHCAGSARSEHRAVDEVREAGCARVRGAGTRDGVARRGRSPSADARPCRPARPRVEVDEEAFPALQEARGREESGTAVSFASGMYSKR